MRYLRLWRRFGVLALTQLLEHRVNVLLQVVAGVGQLALAVVSVGVLYTFSDQVAGWSQPQVLLLLAIYRSVDALLQFQVAPNMRAISGYVRRGALDQLLLYPVPSQFMVSLSRMAPAEGVNLLIGLGLVVVTAPGAGVTWTGVGLVLALAFAGCGVLGLYCTWFVVVTVAIWLVEVDTLDLLFASVFETARYPVDFFTGGVRTVLTVVVPIAFATTFPTQALLGVSDGRLLVLGVVLVLVGLVGTTRFWTYAVRHYQSASS